ncbi:MULTISPECIES: CocE/NonD family hydrolase [unclassified Mycolicibacterium]|uniref:CocE/NonD family hydrolase n=1 Tax=unclassified Mycolicibacterium TaxID=2636767 RepID=UPI001305D99B|nr:MULTISPECIES: CocE/NonD family hydrolase [unclassified Mycolicibacterium]MUL80492.1 CocE/NonD family hydrolase [Mycolicibacterium sp. CBMA 329]MUL86259.1 CocE/NonD family hydrolase [Mycolicibacterium sp. CBMA 331]MUM01079.1 CocE/NonD family hydrolase [Mycolicibacterium sp. CBMA 334]MUM24973.1 CocE/NonD family hydrolase [Mycolicibacterium sp. CBMA 295]MUM36555.1 CocE/NonD family hydrolase [Mycolicibacterium sp. CBMA 247]
MRSVVARGLAIAAVVVLVLGGCGGGHRQPFPAAAGRGPCEVTEQADVPATMRDGTVLRADVYRPQIDRPVPVLLMRTQYGKSGAQGQTRYRPPDWFASHCYLAVIQDVRGQGTSGGVFEEFTHDMDDGYDSVEWAAALPGSSGKVGMYGSSYVGATQWLAAVTAPPHLVTIVPANTASDYYDGWTYEGGEFRLAFVQPWAIGSLALTAAQNRHDQAAAAQLTAAAADPTRWMNFRPFKDLPPLQPGNPAVAPWYFDWIEHSTRDDFWQRVSIRERYGSVRVPVLDIEGWYDAFLAGGVENFTGMVAHGGTQAARDNQRLVIGPWDHVNWGRPDSEPAPLLRDIGTVGNSPINELMLAWYDHFLKDTDVPGDNPVATGQPRVDYFLMGADKWKSATQWPLPQTRWTTLYLSGPGGHADRQGQLVTAVPGAQAPDSYTYDPAFPAPSMGGHSCCGAQSGPQGPYDQTPVEQRSDVLVYSSPPLDHDTEVTGPVSVRLWAQSSAVDTDFTAKLAVVKPGGQVINLNNGIVRTAFRDSVSNPTPIVPGQPYPFQIQVWPTSYEFSTGDRIRLEISSSDYPQFAPNPNTGAPFGQDTQVRTANQTVLHDGQHPSAVTLPIIP